MLRGTPSSPRPSPLGVGPDIDTSYYGAGGNPGRYDDSQETILTLDPSEQEQSAYSRRPQSRSSVSSDDRSAPLYHQHRRQQTAPSLSPLRISTRAGSPVRGHSRNQSDMPFTGDGRVGRRPEASPSRLAGWWSGASTPPTENAPSPDITPKSRRGIPSSVNTTPKSTASAAPSGLGFFASSVSALKTRLTTNPSPNSPQIDDELLDLNIDVALHPPEAFGGHETFSPAAYKNLQANAHGLLSRMQHAYRQQTVTLQELQAERAAEKEEAEETKLRVDNLKMQLEHMARKADEQQQSMKRLMAELNAERKARHEERVAREKILGEGSMVTEDLGVDEEERKKWRKSGGTDKSETSFDTDMDSVESESVFSRSRSPTIMTSATESHFDLPPSSSSSSSTYHGKGGGPSLGPPPPTTRTKSAREMTTLQKLMKNISGDAAREQGEAGPAPPPDGCSNCQGQDASVAWDTVGLLRDENRGLKHRVAELEVAVDGALDLANGVGL
ncbi:uncharacterized protein JN550_012767 [Neoarthrinium moseri]|uniref:uncharacterized protein n=1 Tax=Neoarthrinium moseri TaxID=1658444 RepID=UPI001FDE1DB9|nr:uncharacterized protein JN550_012767 [Neoarthrinium moseri]KAI1858317.1 hypothetical protein JN550_012767 [Neoarthrinium moseri]